ncbi:MAG: decaprenyl-phosphate phosphoribosyltransferase [Chloroflexota bacterium]
MSNTVPSTFVTNLRGLFRTMRPHQWTKNVVVYIALVFDGKLFQLDAFLQTTLVAFSFCLIASCVYIMNDLVDIEKDRQHPRKRLRPLPSGQLNPRFAIVGLIMIALATFIGTFYLNHWVALVMLVYFVQNIAYSFYLKNVVLIDVMLVAFGFLLRVIAGAIIVDVSNFSPWLYVCVTLLALFLGFGKRRHEIALLEGDASKHRSILAEYTLPLLDQIIGIVTTSALIVYTLYSFEAQTAFAGDGQMLITVPPVFYLIARYLYLIHVKKLGGAPDELLIKDRPLLINTIIWMGLIIFLIYFGG